MLSSKAFFVAALSGSNFNPGSQKHKSQLAALPRCHSQPSIFTRRFVSLKMPNHLTAVIAPLHMQLQEGSCFFESCQMPQGGLSFLFDKFDIQCLTFPTMKTKLRIFTSPIRFYSIIPIAKSLICCPKTGVPFRPVRLQIHHLHIQKPSMFNS